MFPIIAAGAALAAMWLFGSCATTKEGMIQALDEKGNTVPVKAMREGRNESNVRMETMVAATQAFAQDMCGGAGLVVTPPSHAEYCGPFADTYFCLAVDGYCMSSGDNYTCVAAVTKDTWESIACADGRTISNPLFRK